MTSATTFSTTDTLNSVRDRMISDLEEETQDIDWFCVDVNGELGHFASGGRGFLPPSVKSGDGELAFLASFIRSQLPCIGRGIESPNFSAHKQFADDARKHTYLEDYRFFGSKGFYSFDCLVSRMRPEGYFPVIVPEQLLRIEDLPDEMRSVLKRTVFSGVLRNSLFVRFDEVT